MFLIDDDEIVAGVHHVCTDSMVGRAHAKSQPRINSSPKPRRPLPVARGLNVSIPTLPAGGFLHTPLKRLLEGLNREVTFKATCVAFEASCVAY